MLSAVLVFVQEELFSVRGIPLRVLFGGSNEVLLSSHVPCNMLILFILLIGIKIIPEMKAFFLHLLFRIQLLSLPGFT